MFDFLDTVGSLLRSALVLSFAAFWGWSSVMFNGNLIAEIADFGRSNSLVLLIVAGSAMFVGFVALMGVLRANAVARARTAAKMQADLSRERVGFDPDAIIQSYVDARQARLSVHGMAQRHQPMLRPLTEPRAFGRKPL